jgi:hypothetical protein
MVPIGGLIADVKLFRAERPILPSWPIASANRRSRHCQQGGTVGEAILGGASPGMAWPLVSFFVGDRAGRGLFFRASLRQVTGPVHRASSQSSA